MMNMNVHEIMISEPMFWEGPDGGKVVAEGLGLVYGSPSFQVAREAFLLKVLHPFTVDNEAVHYLLVSPRLSDSSLDDVMNGECAVNVSRIKPDTDLNVGDEYGGFDIEGWAVGWIKPSSV